MQSICSQNTATFIVNNISFLSVSSLVIFSLPVFLEMEMKLIHPSLTIQCTTLWMLAGMQRALRIAHLVPRVQVELRDTACPSQTMAVYHLHAPNKTTFLVLSISHTEQSVGNPASSLRLQSFNSNQLGLWKKIATQRVYCIPAWLKLWRSPAGFPTSGRRRSLLPLYRTLGLFLHWRNRRALLQVGCCISIAEGRTGPSISDIPEQQICKYKLFRQENKRDAQLVNLPGQMQFLCAQKQPIKSSGEVLPLKRVCDNSGDYLWLWH